MTEDFQLAHHYGSDWPEWGSSPRKPLVQFDGAHKGEWLDSVIGTDPATGKPMVYHIVRCELCILTHIWPIPKIDDLASYYATQFYQQEKPDYIERYMADYDWWFACVHRPILDVCSGLLHLESDTMQARFLELGAGPGIACDAALRTRNWQITAVEPNAALAARLRERGHVAYAGTFEELEDTLLEQKRATENGWHVCYLYECLEHMPAPEDFLLRVWDLLEPGGLLVCVVPNDWNPLQLAACAKLSVPHWWASAPDHVNYFSPKTVQLLVRRAGFQLLDMRGSYPMENFLLDGRNYVGHDDVGRACHAERMRDELSAVAQGQWIAREQQYRENMRARIGREIVAIARKV